MTTDAVRRMFIGGRWVLSASGETFSTMDPTSESVIATVTSGGSEDVDAAVDAAVSGAAMWSAMPWPERSRRLTQFASRIREEVESLAMLDAIDAGLPITGMREDVLGTASEIEYFAGIAGEVKGSTIPTGDHLLAYSRREPYGVVGRIVPFNHPFRFSAGKLAAPLAAGNAVIMKPPEQAPLSALEIPRLAEGLFPDGVINIITGLGVAVGGSIAAHPRIPRVAFTGSVPTGRAVMRACAEHIKHVTLELGGKNPIIICEDADPVIAASATVLGMNITRSMGQSCQSNSRVFVHRSIREPFLAALETRIAALRIGDPRDESTEVGPLAYREHYERVLQHIQDAHDDGARLLCGGGRPDDIKTGFFVSPTVFVDVAPDMRLAQQEVFGPVMAVIDWDDEDELFQMVNGVDFGLTAKIWTRDLARAQRFVARVDSGLVWVNGSGGKPRGLPFGGFKLSGIGKEGGLEEIMSFTREKGVMIAAHT
jgi:betaine-aldehyde dehydrogenase